MHSTPQTRRLERLKSRGIVQRNILVHDANQAAFEEMRPSFAKPEMAETLRGFSNSLSKKSPTNVAQVRQLSPFRYPGGKTWLVPVVREWFASMENSPRLLLEPFAGGAVIGLTAAAEGWVDQVRLVEIDDEISAVWKLTIHGSDQDFERFASSIVTFTFNYENVRQIIDSKPRSEHKKALRTIVKNRAQRGGIMAPGAGLMKNGEGGKGIGSRWYPETLVKRLRAIRKIRGQITFVQNDAFDEIESFSGKDTAMFVDPPYTAGGKKAGSRLYTHNEIDHSQLFELVDQSQGPAMLTYDDNSWVREKASEYGFLFATSLMQSAHLVKMHELVIVKEQF